MATKRTKQGQRENSSCCLSEHVESKENFHNIEATTTTTGELRSSSFSCLTRATTMMTNNNSSPIRQAGQESFDSLNCWQQQQQQESIKMKEEQTNITTSNSNIRNKFKPKIIEKLFQLMLINIALSQLNYISQQEGRRRRGEENLSASIFYRNSISVFPKILFAGKFRLFSSIRLNLKENFKFNQNKFVLFSSFQIGWPQFGCF